MSNFKPIRFKSFFIPSMVLSTLTPEFAFAGNPWNVTIENHTKSFYTLTVVKNQCWNFEDLSEAISIAPDTSIIVETSESYSFPKCTIGAHYVNFLAFLPGISERPIHTVNFANTTHTELIPHASSIKKIRWTNYGDKENIDYLPYDHSLECDSAPNSGKMDVLLVVKENGDIDINSENCEIIY